MCLLGGKLRVVKLMKVCLELFMVFRNGELMKAKHLLSFSSCDEDCTTKGVLICQVISLDFE